MQKVVHITFCRTADKVMLILQIFKRSKLGSHIIYEMVVSSVYSINIPASILSFGTVKVCPEMHTTQQCTQQRVKGFDEKSSSRFYNYE